MKIEFTISRIKNFRAAYLIWVFIPGIFLLECKTEKEDHKPYNVLFLIVDDMNDYGFYHTYPDVKTPHLDALKTSSVTFRNAYCASPVCTPSRASTFSGLYPHSTGAYFNGSDPWRKSEILIKQTETLPELFKRNGYETFGRGKLFHAPLTEGREKQNWDNPPYGGGFGPFPDSLHQLKGKFWGFQAFPDTAFPDVKNAYALADFLKENHQKPFFAALGLWRPHSPFTAPQRFYDLYDINKITIPEGYKENDLADIDSLAKKLIDPFGRFEVSGPTTEEDWKNMIHAYLASTSFADWSIGVVLEQLEKSPYAENTIVVFWSDNGYHCGEKNHWEKGTLWEQADLVPMAIRIPQNKENGRISNQPVSLVDLYPTLVDYCGLQQPAQTLDGKSLSPFLEDTQMTWERPALTTLGKEYTSLRDHRFRYIRYSNGTEELYDHQNDPYETRNIAKSPEATAIKAKFTKYIPQEWAEELSGRRF